MRGIWGNFLVTIILIYSQQAFSITHSKPAYEDYFNFVVELNTIFYDKDNEEYPGSCNASFLNSRYLITAAHCLAGSNLTKKETSVRLGYYRTIKNNQGKIVPFFRISKVFQVKNAYFHPNISKSIRERKYLKQGSIPIKYDLAIVELEESVNLAENKIAPVSVISDYEFAQVKKAPHLHNFVVVSTNLLGADSMATNDHRRFAEFKNIYIDFFMGYFSKYVISYRNNSNTEPGDSGAPLLVRLTKYTWKIAGVVKGHADSYLLSKLGNSMLSRDAFATTENTYTDIVRTIPNFHD